MDCSQRPLRMRRPSGLTRVAAPLIFLLGTTAFAQNATDVQRCEDSESYRYIRTTEPLRPNRPLRQDNISDEEVREVQGAALEVYPDSIVSISGVTDGCNCEEGSNCTAQVWLALYRENQTRSLVLSKIDGHWKIGALQSWLLQYNAHQTSYPGYGRGAPASGHYKIQTEGLHLGPYFLTLRTLDEHGRPQTVASLPGIGNVGSSSKFEVRYEASPRSPSEAVVVASYASALADVSNAQKSGMLVGRELATILTDLLNAALQASYGDDRRHEREEAFALEVFE
jgi:hypothetical protein